MHFVFILIVNQITIGIKKEVAIVLRQLVKIRSIIVNYERLTYSQ